MRIRSAVFISLLALLCASCNHSRLLPGLASNTWTEIARDSLGARRHSSFRYVPDQGYFLLWGYLGFVTEYYGNPEVPYQDNPEYDIVAFDPREGRWRNQFPFEKEQEWGRELPPMHQCDSYQGITTGSYRPQLKEREGVLRPDLNLVFDQVAYDTPRSRMIYFTGGRTFAYDIKKRAWSDAGPGAGPPPVQGGSLCCDPFNAEIVLTGGGHVAELDKTGRLAGYTGTWLYDCTTAQWRPGASELEPPPRMAARLVCDTKDKALVLFGGDSQSGYLADTWIYDTASRQWRASKADSGPPARAGHFTVYDPGTGWVIIGGGYNRAELTDMWAYSVSEDRWRKLKGEVPTGWYLTADIVPEQGLIVFTTSTKTPGDDSNCNEIYPVRTTYAFRIEREGLADETFTPEPQKTILKRSAGEAADGTQPDPERKNAQLERLKSMPVNRWVQLTDPGRYGMLRTWGSCSFDTDRGRLIYWGGGHCGYGGNDYDFYDVEENTWISSPLVAEFPERAWDKGVNAAGVTFGGAPWIRHGRKVYAYDPLSRKIINMKFILLATGYNPPGLADYEPRNPDFGAGENFSASRYNKWVTWSFDPENERWEIVCSAVPGLDLTVGTPRGVMAVDYNWGAINSQNRSAEVTFNGEKVIENSVYLLEVAGRAWKKLSGAGPWPQNLYEMSALVYDSKRACLYLHGGGPERDELWSFDPASGRWRNLNPRLAWGEGKGLPPVCMREAVYLPQQDLLLTCSYSSGPKAEPGVFIYRPGANLWQKADIPAPEGRTMEDLVAQNRSMTYDPQHDLILMVLGERAGDLSRAVVYALRYDQRSAQLVK